MKRGFRSALLLPIAALIGCTVSPNSTDTTPTSPTGDWTNWQIQAGSAITSPPNTYPAFLGAIQIQNTQASGIFTAVSATGASAAEDYGGNYASTTGNVTLSTYGFGLGFTEPASPYTVVPATVFGGCVYPPGYTGVECLALVAYPASVGVEIAPLNGTYTGSLLNSSSPNLSNVSLTLTQSTTPNASGQFPLTGTLVFLGDQASYPMTGTVSGEGITLSYLSPAVSGPNITLAGSTNPTGTQITISNLTWSQPSPAYTLTGILVRQ